MGTWQPVRRTGKAIYSFKSDGEHQVSLQEGTPVYAEFELGGWYRGSVQHEGRTLSGIFPVSYVRLDECPAKEIRRERATSLEVLSEPPHIEAVIVREKPRKQIRPNVKQFDQSPGWDKEQIPPDTHDRQEEEERLGSSISRQPSCAQSGVSMNDEMMNSKSGKDISRTHIEDCSLAEEISMVIPGFETQLKSMLVGGVVKGYHDMKQKVAQLLSMRRILMDPNIDDTVRENTRVEIIGILESCRRSSEGHICPRTPNHSVANTSNTPIRQLIKLHQEMYSVVQQESSSLWRQKMESRQVQMLGDASKSNTGSCFEAKDIDFDSKLPKTLMSLCLDVKACIFSVGEPTHVYFTLFSVQKQQFISEEYVVELTAAGMPHDINLLGKLHAEFREIESAMFKEGLYLTCHIYRIGQLKVTPKNNQKRQKLPQTYRRPFGCAVLNISCYSSLFETFGDWTSPPHLTIYRAKDPLQFIELHNLIIRGASCIEIVPQTKGFAVGLKLEEMKPTSDPASCVQMLQLSSFINPVEDRNDFYVTLRGGDFLQDKKKSSKNIEIRIRVFTAGGFLVPDCIYRGAGPTVTALTEYCSTVYYHWNSPVYCESIKLKISKEIFSQCHLLFTIWHVSSSPEKNQLCSFTFLPLTCSSGAVIADGLHVLPCYKPIKHLGQQNAILRYLDANAHFRDNSKQRSQSVLTKRKEEIFVETLLSSVKTTQLDSLHALFNWRHLDAFQLKSTVAKFTTISGTELSKFVKEVFDTLFSIIRTFPNHNDELSNLAYIGLLHCIDQLTTKMCSVSGSIDAYIADVYSFPDVYSSLISHSQNAFLYATQHNLSPNPSMFKQLTLLSKCFQYVVKFIVRSAQCSQVANLQPFREQFKGFLDEMFMLLAIQGGPKDSLIGCKAFLLRSFSSTFNDLSLVFPSEDLGNICLSLLSAVPHHPDNSKLFVYKLRMIGNIAQSVADNEKSCWKMIQTSVIESIHFHLTNSHDESYLSVGILSTLFATIQAAALNNTADLIPFYPLLDPLVRVLSSLRKDLIVPSPQILQMCTVDILLETYSLFYTILHSIDVELLNQWTKANVSFFPELIAVCESALSHSVYPSTWIILRSWELSIIARILNSIASFSMSLEQSVIQSLLHCCVVFYGHKDFQNLKETNISFNELSSLPVSVTSAASIVWNNIHDYSDFAQYFFTNLFVPMFNFPEDDVDTDLNPMQTLAIGMFHDLLMEEFARTGEFSEINRLTVDTLDSIAHESQQNAFVFLNRLEKALMSRLGNACESLQSSVRCFLSQLGNLYDLMKRVLQIPATNAFEHERADVLIQLLEYLLSDTKVGKRKGMLFRYHSHLLELNCSIGAFAEAGNTILRQLRLLEWSDQCTSVWWEPGDGLNSRSESEAERKESLYLKAIEYFGRGDHWEAAIMTCEELRHYYQEISFNYRSLALILEKEAAFFSKIATESRFFPSYFRVVFFRERGNRTEYVYRGLKLESIMDFTARIRTKYPNARIVMSSDDPNSDILSTHDLVITVITVTLSSFQESQGVTESGTEGIPKKIRLGQQHQNASWFMFCKAENRSAELQPSNEFKDLWVKKTFIRTAEPFPNVQRRQLVVDSVQRIIDPIDTAREMIQKKNDELKAVICDVQANRDPSPDLGPLTMQLNGIIDAAVNGGTKKYIEAFLSCDMDGKETSRNQLKQAMTSQIQLLQCGLNVFKEKKNADLDPLYNRLKELFEKMAETRWCDK